MLQLLLLLLLLQRQLFSLLLLNVVVVVVIVVVVVVVVVVLVELIQKDIFLRVGVFALQKKNKNFFFHACAKKLIFSNNCFYFILKYF